MALLLQQQQQQQQQPLHHSIDPIGALAESVLEKIHKDSTAGSDGSVANPRININTPFGVKALQGQRPNMEDAYSVQMTPPSTSQPVPAPPGTPPQQQPQQPPDGPSPGEGISDEAEAIQVPVLPEDLVGVGAAYERFWFLTHALLLGASGAHTLAGHSRTCECACQYVLVSHGALFSPWDCACVSPGETKRAVFARVFPVTDWMQPAIDTVLPAY